jgi:hypothetical protein
MRNPTLSMRLKMKASSSNTKHLQHNLKLLKQLLKTFGKKSTPIDQDYELAQLRITTANEFIKNWVHGNYYPQDWMVEFNQTRRAKLEHSMVTASPEN